MKKKRVGTIIHGALGDCYEQILCLMKYKQAHNDISLIAFFAVENRLRAFQHFDLSVFDQVYLAKDISRISVDEFYQFQINDAELLEEIIDKLPPEIQEKFDFKKNILPWDVLKKHNFSTTNPLELKLSDKGKCYYRTALNLNDIDESLFKKKSVLGFYGGIGKKDLLIQGDNFRLK